MTAFYVEQMWQDFDDLAIGGRGRKRRCKKQAYYEGLERTAHKATIAAVVGDSSEKLVRGRAPSNLKKTHHAVAVVEQFHLSPNGWDFQRVATRVAEPEPPTWF